MKIRQISVFLENQPGRLAALCRTLADAGVNLSTLMLSETGEFGLLRIITPDADKARAVVEKAGYAVTASEVLAIQVPDKPGGLAAVLTALDPHQISVEYMYAFACRTGRAIMIIRFNDLDRAADILQKAGLKVINTANLFGP
ncbi:MAG: ACT domain-containing protein [Verrucomicrobia bacterium]|nr:ACT domain-containing protein [Verrucomicrobiota bacterium]